MKAAAVLVLLVAGAATAEAIKAFRGQRGHSKFTGNMRPDVVAKTLAKVEDDWRKEAAAFAECDLAHAGQGADTEACASGPGSFKKSCSVVVNAVLQSSNGDRAVVSEYMSDLCREPELKGWRETHCNDLSQMLSVAMTGDSYDNREALEPSRLCQIYWQRFEKGERTRVEKEKVEKAEREKKEAEARSTAMKDAKKKAVEDAEKAEAEKKATEKRHKAEEAANKATLLKHQAEEAAEMARQATRKLTEKRQEAEKQAAEAKKKAQEVETASKKKDEAEKAAHHTGKQATTVAPKAQQVSSTTAPTMSEANRVLAAAAKELSEPMLAADAPKAVAQPAPVAQPVPAKPAAATTAPPAAKPAGVKEQHAAAAEKVFKAADKDGDGSISKAEFVAAASASVQKKNHTKH